jgi:hypothetical protein
LGRGIKWLALEKLSTTVRIVVLPSDLGRPVTKSRGIWEEQGVVEEGRPKLAADSYFVRTHSAGGDECRDIRNPCGTGAWMAGQFRGMCPFQDWGQTSG